MAKKIPTLDSSGYLQAINDQADRLMAYYLSADINQSTLYAGNVGSFQGRLAQYAHQYDDMVEVMREDLQRLFLRQFDSAHAEVTYKDLDTDTNRLNITFDITITDQGRTYSLGRLIEVMESRVVNILDITSGKSS